MKRGASSAHLGGDEDGGVEAPVTKAANRRMVVKASAEVDLRCGRCHAKPLPDAMLSAAKSPLVPARRHRLTTFASV